MVDSEAFESVYCCAALICLKAIIIATGQQQSTNVELHSYLLALDI